MWSRGTFNCLRAVAKGKFLKITPGYCLLLALGSVQPVKVADEVFVSRCENGVQFQTADSLRCIISTELGLKRSRLKHF